MKNEQIAKVAHEVNRAYCQSVGDYTQPKWEDAPKWQIASALAGVELHIRDPNAGVEDSHVSWMNQKLADGWKYGVLKDEDRKTHPCIVPYNKLSVEQQTKDYIFRQVVHSMVALESSLIEEPVKSIKGYKVLSPEQVNLMNEVKSKANEVGELLDRLRHDPEIQGRDLAIAKTNLQTGFMWAVRSIAKPESF